MDNLWAISFYSLSMMMLGVALTNLVSLINRIRREKREWVHKVDMRMLDFRLLEKDVKWLMDCECARMRAEKESTL